MRLICPNCGAHYAIDPRIIPEAGRDVQCSACGHTWFQTREAAAANADAPDVAARATQPEVPDAVPPPLDPPKREIDPEVMSVLREEAAHERAVRAAERQALEVQADLDLAEPSEATEAADTALPDPSPAEIAAASRGPIAMADEGDPALKAAPRASTQKPRRSLLPDIEEINSTLEPAEHASVVHDLDRPEPPSARIARARRGQGRRIGFGMACLAFALATVLYNKGPQIGDAVPAFKPGLDVYVTKVQEGRIWLDTMLRRAGGVGTES